MEKGKLISPDFFPNFEKDDLDLITKILKNKNDWQEGRELEILKFELKKIFPNGYIFLFTTERGALENFLRFYFKYEQRKKVATQAFSCFVVPKAIINAGGIPVFIDISKNSLNFNLDQLEKIFKNHQDISAVILQNTFGVPNNLEDILNFLKDKNVLIIENLAHSFGGKFNGKYLGNFGDIALLSFGRSKVISSIFGGVLVINNKKLAEDFEIYYKNLTYPSKIFILRCLIYTILIIKLRSNFNNLNKNLMILIRKLNLAVLEISKKERRGSTDLFSITKMPNVFAKIALNQIKKLFKLNDHRKIISDLYLKEGIIPYGEVAINSYEFYYLRYPLISTERKKIIEYFKKFNIYLGNWYDSVLAPINKRLDRFGYYYGMCPNAENLTYSIFNLPTNILTTEEDALLISEILKSKKWL
jgi:perosamine synthetase